MGKRRKVPEDLMGTILGEAPGAAGEDQAPSELRDADRGSASPGDVISWEERPERVGVTLNLSKQLDAELDRLRMELQDEGEIRPSRSEIAEVALRIAVDDARQKGNESELIRRLGSRHAAQTAGVADEAGHVTLRGVDGAGYIIETTYDENGNVVDEDVVSTVADLPVESEYVDEEGRLVSLAKDELGNTFEQVMDEQFNLLGTRLLPGTEPDAR